MDRPRVVACREGAGRVETTRLAVRSAAGERPGLGEDGVPRGLELVEGPLAPGVQRLGAFELRVSLDAQGEAARLDVSVCNRAEAPLFLESVVLGFRWSGPEAGSVRFLRHGWQSWSLTEGRPLDDAGPPPFPSGPWLRGLHHGSGVPAPDRSGWHESDLLSVAEGEGGACLVGLLERGEATGLVYLRRDGAMVALEVEARLEVPLAPGETRRLEAVRVAVGPDANALLEEHAALHGAESGARTGSPFQAGWCTWYHSFHRVSEEDLLRNLESLAARRVEIPVDVVQLDDGFQRATGDWLETNERFPRGLAPLAGAIRDAGFRPGLWTAPFCVVAESRVQREHPEWLLRSGDGPLLGLLHPVWAPDARVQVLDTSREEVRAHLMRTFAALAGMGFGYLKLDFLYTVAMRADAHDPALTRAARLRRGLEAIRQGAGEEAFLLGCGCPLGAAVGMVDGMRIGADVAPQWRVADPIEGIEATQPAAANAIRAILSRAWMHRRLWLNDPDCLLARTRDTGLSPAEVRTLASVIGASGGMLVFSDEVPALGDEEAARVRSTLELAREVDAAGERGVARAIDLLARDMPRGLVAPTAAGGVVALVNPREQEVVCDLDLTGVGLAAGRIQAEPLLGTRPGRLETSRLRARLGPHESAVVRALGSPLLGVFCDFDGTFAVQDVGSTLARRYAADRRSVLWKDLQSGALTPWQYNIRLFDGLPLPEEELDSFLRTVELNGGAGELVDWCAASGVPFLVLSDGFDRNLDRLQELTGVRFAYQSNHLWYENGCWRIAPGGPDERCSCGTGVCKRARIEKFRAVYPAAAVAHIGNGRVSDLCASLASDVVFAKDTLAEELESRGVAFEPFETLREVREGLERRLADLAAKQTDA